jgi:hypothetical protein
MEQRITPERITSLKPGFIFTFGSNEAGRHGKGAAKQALRWGAVYFRGIGMQGQTYAIPTKDRSIKTLPLDKIQNYVEEFIDFAIAHPELTFLVVEIGCMLAGYKPEQIAPLFKRAIEVENIHLPRRFWTVLKPESIVRQTKLF